MAPSLTQNRFEGGVLGPKGMYRGSTARDKAVKRILNGEVQYEGTIRSRQRVKVPDAPFLRSIIPGIRVLPFFIGGELHSLYYTPWHYFNIYPVGGKFGTVEPGGFTEGRFTALEEALNAQGISLVGLYDELITSPGDVLFWRLEFSARGALAFGVQGTRGVGSVSVSLRVDARRSSYHHNVFSVFSETNLVVAGRMHLLRSTPVDGTIYSLDDINRILPSFGGTGALTAVSPIRVNNYYKYYYPDPSVVVGQPGIFPLSGEDGEDKLPPFNIEYTAVALDNTSTLIYDTQGVTDPVVLMKAEGVYSLYYLEETRFRYFPITQRINVGATLNARNGDVPRIPASNVVFRIVRPPEVFTDPTIGNLKRITDSDYRLRSFSPSELEGNGIYEYGLPTPAEDDTVTRERVTVHANLASIATAADAEGRTRHLRIEPYVIYQDRNSAREFSITLGGVEPSIYEADPRYRLKLETNLEAFPHIRYDEATRVLIIDIYTGGNIILRIDLSFLACFEEADGTVTPVGGDALASKLLMSFRHSETYPSLDFAESVLLGSDTFVARSVELYDWNNINIDLTKYIYVAQERLVAAPTYIVSEANTLDLDDSSVTVAFGLDMVGMLLEDNRYLRNDGDLDDATEVRTRRAAVLDDTTRAFRFPLKVRFLVRGYSVGVGLYGSSLTVDTGAAGIENEVLKIDTIYPVVARVSTGADMYETRHGLAVESSQSPGQVLLVESGQSGTDSDRTLADPTGKVPVTDGAAVGIHTFGSLNYLEYVNAIDADKAKLNFWTKLIDSDEGLPTQYASHQFRMFWFARSRYGISNTVGGREPILYNYFRASDQSREVLSTDAFFGTLPYIEGSRGVDWASLYEGNLLIGLKQVIYSFIFASPVTEASFIPQVFTRFDSGGIIPVRLRNFLYKVDGTRKNVERLETQFQYQSQYSAVTVSNKLATDYLANSRVLQLVEHPLGYGIYLVLENGRVFYGYVFSDGTVGWSEQAFPLFVEGSRMFRVGDSLYYPTPQGNYYVVLAGGVSVEMNRVCEVELLPVALFVPEGDEIYLEALGKSVRCSVVVNITNATNVEDNYVGVGQGNEIISQYIYDGEEIREHVSDVGDGKAGLLVSYEGQGDFTLLRVARSLDLEIEGDFGLEDRIKHARVHPLLPSWVGMGKGLRGPG